MKNDFGGLTLLSPCSHPALTHTARTLLSLCTHAALTLCTARTLLSLCSLCTHAALTLCSRCSHSVHCTHTALTLCSHTLLTLLTLLTLPSRCSGHDNEHTDNIYAYVGQGIGFLDAPMLDGHEDTFASNHVVLTGSNVGSFTCKGTDSLRLWPQSISLFRSFTNWVFLSFSSFAFSIDPLSCIFLRCFYLT